MFITKYYMLGHRMLQIYGITKTVVQSNQYYKMLSGPNNTRYLNYKNVMYVGKMKIRLIFKQRICHAMGISTDPISRKLCDVNDIPYLYLISYNYKTKTLLLGSRIMTPTSPKSIVHFSTTKAKIIYLTKQSQNHDLPIGCP